MNEKQSSVLCLSGKTLSGTAIITQQYTSYLTWYEVGSGYWPQEKLKFFFYVYTNS